MAIEGITWDHTEKITSIGLSIFSTACVVIHLHKVFQTKTPQSLLTKYLTFYCFFLLLIYVFTFMRGIVFLMELGGYSQLHKHRHFGNFILYFMLTATLIKFIIAMDLFWCFRKIAIYQQLPFLATENKKFIIYCLLSISIPTIYTSIWISFAGLQDWRYTFVLIVRIIRITRLFLIVGAVWYIRSAGMNRQELWSKYSLHIRILIMVGGVSSIMTILEVVSAMIQNNDVNKHQQNAKQMEKDVYFWINVFGYFLEGMYIRILITFRKDTFQSTTADIPRPQSAPVTSL